MNKRGLVFIIILVFVLILTIAAGAFIFLSSTEVRMTRSQADSVRALYIAEAGIQHTIAQLREDWDNQNSIQGAQLGEGSYSVTMFTTDANGNPLASGRLRVRSAGTVNNEVRTVEVILLSSDRFGSPGGVTNAIETEGLLEVRGSAEISGTVKQRVQTTINFPANPADALISVASVDGFTIGDSISIEEGTANQEIGRIASLNPSTLYMTLEDGISSSHATGSTVYRTIVFGDIFGVEESEMEGIAKKYYSDTYYDRPFDNDIASGVTWVDSGGVESQITTDTWSGSGILIVNGDLKITGGTFYGIIWVIGELRISGNPLINGAIFVECGVTVETDITGNPEINYSSDAVGDAFYQLSSLGPTLELWKEVF